MNEIVGTHSILFVTLDALRYDVGNELFQTGRTPNLARLFPMGWEMRHSPGTFTFAAHHAFFAGFLPTPVSPGTHARLFAAEFEGSETTTADTYVFRTPDIVSGFRQLNYRNVCIGGVGFFNKRTPLGTVLPSLFDESYWRPDFGVTDAMSTFNQFNFGADWIRNLRNEEKFFMFINVSAIHQPNYFYQPGAAHDSRETHKAALAYVDSQLPTLIDAVSGHGNTLCIFCSDHGTAYGEDGYFGHRFSHPVVLTVPYAHTILKSLHDDH